MSTRQNVTLGALVGLGVAGIAAKVVNRRKRKLDLRGANVFVTGGTRGLGLATAREFVRRGANVAICARSGPELQRAEHELQREAHSASLESGDAFPSQHVLAVMCDVTDPKAANAAIDGLEETFGPIDVLVNCAAEISIGPVEAFHATDFQVAFHRIFFSLYHPTMAAFGRMCGRGRGRIVNVASIGGRMPQPHLGTYVAAKFAVTGFSDTLAIEARKFGIRVTTIAPPPLRNAAFLNARVKGDWDKELSWFARALTKGVFSIDTERAARAIVTAAEYGDATSAVSPLGWLPTRLYALAPGFMIHLMALVDRALPRAPAASSVSISRKATDVVARSSDVGLNKAVESSGANAERYMQPARS